MHDIAAFVLQFIYLVCVCGLAIYGLQAFWLTGQVLWRTQSAQHFAIQPRLPATLPTVLPTVTIQLPIYNEQHVAERLIDACAQLNYPLDKLQIQVLDDSTDQTTALVQRRAQCWQARGWQISVLHRVDRSGYKAGALAAALPQASGEYIAIFDADFAPPPDFLLRALPPFFAEQGERIGFVQARWGHLNQDYSPLTRAQALALDGHFVVEQAGRQAAGYPFGFNGSAGIWRRACIADPAVGGWQTDTLCEDLDLSYRAQLAGWHPHYLDDLVAPAEIPPQLAAFKRQQFRWAKGSVQTLRKVGGRVWRSPWPLIARLAALCHLGGYLLHPLLLGLLLITLPLLLLQVAPGAPLALLSLFSFGPPLLYAVAQRKLHPADWWRRWSYLWLLTLLGSGLCLNNSVAVWQGLRGQGGDFLRTPKFRVEQAGDRWQKSSYRLPLDRLFWGEVFLFGYATLTVTVALWLGQWASALFLSLYAGGFGALTLIGLRQASSPPRLARRLRALPRWWGRAARDRARPVVPPLTPLTAPQNHAGGE